MSINSALVKNPGPSGFIQYGQDFLIVDYGQVIKDGVSIGKIYDDGFMQVKGNTVGNAKNNFFIDQINDLSFRGTDSFGLTLELPITIQAPSGDLYFDGKLFKVINGRICDSLHSFHGVFDQSGNIYLRDPQSKRLDVKLDENTMLNTRFMGVNHLGEKFNYEFMRPLNRHNRNYVENEILRYFDSFDSLTSIQKKYVNENLNIWAACGILQLVRKSEGNCAFGDIRHGASGVTGVRTGNVTLDKDEFDTEIKLFFNDGPLSNLFVRNVPLHVEARVNMVVAHEFGHQLEFTLNQKAQERVIEIYNTRFEQSAKLFPYPHGYEGRSEILTREQIQSRVFYSGYAKESHQEFFAETIAAFSVTKTREDLKFFDRELYDFICQIILDSPKMLSTVLTEQITDLQLSLRLADVYKENLI